MRYPGAVQDPDTGAWISDAEVAEVSYTAFAGTKDRFTARLVVRRVKDARYPDALFPVWRYHPFFTNTDRTDRPGRHHPPPPRDHRDRVRRPDRRPPGPHALRAVRRELRLGAAAPRSRTTCCAPPAHSSATPTPWPAARPCAGGSSPSRPDWPDPPADRSCTYPAAGPGHPAGNTYGTSVIGHSPPATA